MKSATKYHYSSTMANIIGLEHKPGKKNRKWPDVTSDTSNKTSYTSHSHDKINENIYVESKKSLSADTYSIKNSSLQDATDYIIQTKHVSRTNTTNMLDKNVTVDYESKFLKPPGKDKHCATARSTKVLLGYDSLKYQKNNTTDMKGQKVIPSGKEYICFKTDG